MKKLCLLIASAFIVVLATSCSRIDPSELRIKNEFCLIAIKNNDELLSSIIFLVGPSQNPKLIRVIKISEKIVNWRKNYLDHKTRKNLLAYSDSILTVFAKTPYSDTTVVKEIEDSKKGIKSADSLSVLNLLYWTLRAERLILEEKSADAGNYCGFTSIVASFTNGDVFSSKDTVIVSVNSVYTQAENCKFDFSDVKCINETTNRIVKPKIVKTGPVYVLFYIPEEPGNYVITGKVEVIEYPGFSIHLKMYNDFSVK